MKHRTTAWREAVEQTMYRTDLHHSSPGFCPTFIVLAVPARPARPGVRALNHPALFQRRAALRACRTPRDFDAPTSTMCSHPGGQRLGVILLIRTDRAETRQGVGRNGAEHDRGRHPLIET